MLYPNQEFLLLAILCLWLLTIINDASSPPAALVTPHSAFHRSSKMKKLTLFITLFLLPLLASACQPSRQPDPTATRPPSPTATQTATPTITPTPLPTATPTNTPTPTPMSSTAIFDQVSPAIAFIETPAGTGSGLLIEGGYVVTNAHVVWPFQEVRLVFPDGSEYAPAPVLKWNLMADLAVVGPIKTTITPVVLADGEAEVVGSDVYLIGYPGEVEAFPRPTITRGLISRMREWETLSITYFQTDATIAGGQSGGVLVNQKAQVIGISGFYFTEAMFGLVASVADVQPLIEEMTTDETVSIEGSRTLPLDGGQPEQELWLWNGESAIFIANVPAGDDLQVQVESEVQTALEIVDVYGTILAESDSSQTGRTTASATAMIAAPHFVLVYALGGENMNRLRVSSNQSLIPYAEWDDYRQILTDQTRSGLIDYPGDTDYLTLTLVKGQTVHVTMDSLLLDPYLAVMHDNWDTAVEDDNSGGGLFGLNAGLTYQAPHSGEYYIYVADATGYYVGGYQIQVAVPAAGAPTPIAPPITPTPGPFGAMGIYESDAYPFTIQYPAAWYELAAGDPSCSSLASACYANEDYSALLYVMEELMTEGYTLDSYKDAILSGFSLMFGDYQVLSRQPLETAQGLPAQVMTVSVLGGALKMSFFMYLHEDEVAFVAMYLTSADAFNDLEPLITYSFSTFTVK